MNEGTRSGKSTIRLLGISAERPTNGLYLLPVTNKHTAKLHHVGSLYILTYDARKIIHKSGDVLHAVFVQFD
jgi:hypothetical protein